MRAVVMSDTHARSGCRDLPATLIAQLSDADVIFHAGDVVDGRLLDELAEYTVVHAVLGNNDHGLADRLPERLEVVCDGVPIAMVHDSGARTGRPARMKRWFPDADVVIFGHSHDPVDEAGNEGQRLFNPGSPTQRRRQPQATFGVLEIQAGKVTHHEIIAVPTSLP